MWYSPVQKEQNAQNRQGNTIDTSKYQFNFIKMDSFNENTNCINSHNKQ